GAGGAVLHALRPLLGSGALFVLILWAAAAVALPYALQAPSPLAVIAGALAWAAALAVGCGLVAGALRGAVVHPDARGIAAGALTGAALAAGWSLLRARRSAPSFP